MSVLARLFILVLLAVLPGLALQLYEQSTLRAARRAQAVEEVRRDVYALADKLQQVLDGAQNLLLAIASAPEVREQDWDRCNRLLAELGEASPAYTGFAVADLQGVMRCNSRSTSVGVSVAERDYFREAIESRQPGLGTYTIARPRGLAILPMTRPVFDKSGELIGVAIGGLRIQWLAEHYQRRPRPPNALTFVADRDGTVLVRLPGQEEWVGKRAPDAALPYLKRDEPAITEGVSPEGIRRIVALEPASVAPAIGLHVASGLPTEYLFAPVERTSERALIIALLGAVLAAGALLFGGTTMINRPLRNLTLATEALRKGDYGAASALRPGKDEFGRLAAAFRAMSDTIAERESKLRDGEERYRLAAHATNDAIWDWHLETGRILWTDAVRALFGHANDERIASADWWKDQIHPDDRARVVASVATIIKSRQAYWTEEYRFRRADGTWAQVFDRGHVLRGPDGRAVRMIGAMLDMTARREAEERLKLLAAEVDHRAKNMLGVVQAMIRLTRADTVVAFRAAILGRIATLARAHTLLSQSRWEGADLRKLVEEELAPHRRRDGTRIGIDGPPLALTPAAAQSMAMALHELATNAAKYGSLSAPLGRVTVAWQVQGGTLTLQWTETGGPHTSAPQRRGLGTGVIERAVRDQLGGTVTFNWRETGLVCGISVPDAQLTERAAAE